MGTSEILNRNLNALERHSAQAAHQLRMAQPVEGLSWFDAAPDGAQGAMLWRDGKRMTLASRYRPIEEAERFAEELVVADHPAVLLVGLGAGHHARVLSQRLGPKGVLMIHEPSPALARAVLATHDLSDVLERSGVYFWCGAVEDSDLTVPLEPIAPLLIQGVKVMTHPSARLIDGEGSQQFIESFHRVLAYMRTLIATTLVNTAVTCRNLTMNLGQYAAGATINALKDAYAGRPVVVVSAGPSLAKNASLLAEPGVRDRVVIIAVQTALRPLLDRGVRPHFVTALDYHEISQQLLRRSSCARRCHVGGRAQKPSCDSQQLSGADSTFAQ